MGTNQDNQGSRSKKDYVLPRKEYTIQPLDKDDNPAADMIRDKLAKLYASEPDALAEEKQVETVQHRSVHQDFMHQLNNSGKSLAQVQTEWHNYYIALPDDEKHKVWQEFYSSNQNAQSAKVPEPQKDLAEKIGAVRADIPAQNNKNKRVRQDKRSSSKVQQDIKEHATKKKLGAKQHLQSLLFGLGIGFAAILLFLFSFFNEVVIAPFIQPARTSAATPLIVGSETVAPSKDPQVIIPKINVQIPIQFGINSTTEETMQKELESGVAHYPTTSNPGENGNGAYFGHSSNNIFNKGKYKFAFVLLSQIVPGDTFYITKDGKLFAYKVFDVKIVEPYQTEVLQPVEGHSATATLITCDPPGTSLRRLVVTGDQISPDPGTNTIASAKAVDGGDETQLVSNGETLWGRLFGNPAGKVLVAILFIAAVLILFRRTSKPHKQT